MKLYLEVDGLGRDENEQPCPASVVIDGLLPDEGDYAKLTQEIDLPALCKAFFHDVIVPDRVHIITEEKYLAEYGEDEDG